MQIVKAYQQRVLWVYTPMAALFVLLFLLLSKAWLPLPPQQVRILSGPSFGMYDEYAKQYALALQAKGVKAEVTQTAGTGENIRRLADSADSVDIAFAQTGYALGTRNPYLPTTVETLAVIDIEPVWIFSRSSDVNDLSKLRGMRLSAGSEESGSRSVAQSLLDVANIKADEVRLSSASGAALIDGLSKGELDGAILVASASAPIVHQLFKTPGLHLAQIQRVAALTQQIPYLDLRYMSANSLGPETPKKNVLVLYTQANLLVQKKLHPIIKRVLADTAVALHGKGDGLRKVGEFPHLRGLEFPTSVSTRDMLFADVPWPEQHLSAQGAQWVYRIVFIGAPLLLFFLALARFVAFTLLSRINRRVDSLYGELKLIERDLAADGAATAGLESKRWRDRIFAIDKATTALHGMPHPWRRVHTLRQHTQFVMSQLTKLAGR